MALFLGAGFSKWAVDLPVANQLFDFDIELWGPRENRKLEIVKSLKHNWDTTHPEGLTEQFIADALNFQEKKRQAVLWYVVRRLSEPFIWKEFHAQKWRRHVLMIDENRRFDILGVVKAQRFLKRFTTPSLAGIITTNYDMIVEYSLGTKGFNYGVTNQTLIGRGPYPVSQWRYPVTLKGETPLAKIHGSISWDENALYTDGRRGVTGHALIVAPTPEKEPPESLEPVWELAERILQRATCLVVFGFAFNPYDEAVLNLLKCAGSNVESVLLIDIEPRIESARQLWPDAMIASCQPPPKGDMEI
ncbi:MAG: hypothetical protein ACETV1_08075, partial [Candidatus Bathyarchaeia archaeon]